MQTESTRDIIEAMNERSFAAIDMLLSRGNVLLQRGAVLSDKDIDALLRELVSYEIGEY